LEIPDVTSWDWIISERDKFFRRNNASEDETKIIIEGYKEMRGVLGEDFLRKSSNSMVPSLHNFALWCLLKNADFGQKLGLLKGRNNFEDTKQDLLRDNFENSFGAEAVVEVAGDFISKGLDLELIGRKKDKRTPDFKVKVADKWIYFEITTLRTYPEEMKSVEDFRFKLQREIDKICHIYKRFIEVDFNGMMRRDAESCFDEIISKTKEMVQSPEELEIVICGVKLKSLRKEEGYGLPYIYGIRMKIDEMNSISRKLLEKLDRKQLPDKECGVLLVFTRSPFLPDFQVLSEGLAQLVRTEPNLSAAVIQYISVDYISHERLGLSVGNDKFEIIHRTEHDDLYNRYNIIIPNPNLKGCDIKSFFK
jgi:hypothetical protein